MEVESECLLIEGLISEGKNRLSLHEGVGQVVQFILEQIEITI